MTTKTQTEVLPAAPAEPAPMGDVGAQMILALPNLMQQALAAGSDGVAALERLVALHATLRADMAREQFFHALSGFQAKCPSIQKNRLAEVRTKSGAAYSYRFADFEQIVSTIRPALRDHGLSFSFDTSQEGGAITVTCKLRHQLGHTEFSTFTCPTSSPSGQMSDQQKVGGALTFAKRYALTAALGIATADDDSDAVGHEEEEEPALDEAAVDILEERLRSLGVDRAAFLRYFRIDGVTSLPPSKLKEAHEILDQKMRNAAKSKVTG